MSSEALTRGDSETAFVDAVYEASLRLMRIALGFGLACTGLVLAGAIASGKGTTTILIATCWLIAWALATAFPAVVWEMLEHHFFALTSGVAIASALGVAFTGGIDSPLPIDANWIVWAASVVVTVRKVLSLSLAIAASHLAGFLLGGPWSSDTNADPTYYALTQIVNPIAMAVAALALTGVFRLVLNRTPDILGAIRSGSQLDAPRFSPRLSLPPTAALTTESLPTKISDSPETLTLPELEIIDRLARGEKPKQIAFESRRSLNTIYEHIANAKRKCGARTTTHLITRAWRAAD